MKGKIGSNSPGFILLNAWNWVALCNILKKKKNRVWLWFSLESSNIPAEEV